MLQEDFTFVSASEYSLNEIVGINNRVWKGYFRDMTTDVSGFSNLMRLYTADISQSVVALNEEKYPVGLTNLGVRGSEGWVAGFALDPEYRKKGLGSKLMQEIINRASNLGLSMLYLEFIEENVAASKLYTRLGFIPTGKLISFKLPVEELLTSLDEEQLLDTEVSWINPHWTSNRTPMCWTRQAFTIRSGKHISAALKDSLGMPRTGLLVKYDKKDVIILDSLITINSTVDDFIALLKYFVNDTTENIQIFNEPEGSPFSKFLENMGFKVILSQWGMSLKIGKH
ncbi:hypothetical protein K7432_000814 [Basidiobolus ranarum]|uniref:N-acetyltransferase domain-containing protein n=1 Tax=Basidiobolus ranarum TaxID=34480 RepID=A0ABR2WAM1_9FUNG